MKACLCCRTCPEAELVEVRAAAAVGFTQVVTATVWGLGLHKLIASVPAGAGGRHVDRQGASCRQEKQSFRKNI